MVKWIKSDKEFFSVFLSLAIPIAMQNFIGAALNMVDVFMVGLLGKTELAAVGLANQVFFVLSLFLYGISSGCAIFTAQFWGKKDTSNIHRILGLSLGLSILITSLFTVAATFFPKQILSLFSEDPGVVLLGAKFLRIIALSYILSAVSFSYSFILRGIGQAKVPMRVAVIAIIINTLLNYVFIFGKWGFPPMGVEGAALATVIARAVEAGLIIMIVYLGRGPAAAKISAMLNFPTGFVKTTLRTIMPVVLNESLWATGVVLYSVVFARMGTEVVAAVNIAMSVERLASVFFFGVGHACSVMLGNQLGAGNENKSFEYAKRFNIIGPVLGIITGVLLLLFSGHILGVFEVPIDVKVMAGDVLMIISFAMAVKAFNMVMIIGILRSGGDTKFSLIMDLVGTWFIGVPLAFIGGLIWRLPLEWVYCLIIAEEIFKFILGIRRFVTKKWVNNLVKHL
ncbi:MAG: MATE family efflux transporter [Clostridia bacterium]|nr:MATE family efflux transporter [Clostridia bacterium]